MELDRMRRSLESFTDGTHTEVTRVTHRFRQNHGLINIKYIRLEIYFLPDRTPEHALRVTGMLDIILCAFGTQAMAQCAIALVHHHLPNMIKATSHIDTFIY